MVFVLYKKRVLFVFLLVFSVAFAFFLSLNFVSAVNCWQYTSSNNASCTSANGCAWKVDAWNPTGWCEELSCYRLFTQSECSSAIVPGKNCTWTGGTTYNSCDAISCWNFAGTNANSCVNNTAGRSCMWSTYCYPVIDGYSYCGGYQNQSSCLNATGCGWGACGENLAGCSSYVSSSTCNVAKNSRGNNCTWYSTGGSNYCKENNCWDSALYPNSTSCNNAVGISCEWKWGSCQEKSCSSFDGNQTGCVTANTTSGIDCVWDGSYCRDDNCWNYVTNATCSVKSDCTWQTHTSTGRCNEVNCWSWDKSMGGSESACYGNSSLYGLSCRWSNQTNTPGVNGTGWCEVNYASQNCTSFTTERNCMNTYYCWWKANNYNNSALGGNCTEPTWGTGDFSGIGSIKNDWNPGCYIFDNNETRCNQTLGCGYNGFCRSQNNSYGSNISLSGITCTYINNSNLCNNIASLSSCCSWTNGSCLVSNYSFSCFNNLQQTPNSEKSCEDAKTKTSCETIAGDPWYMPCKWDNSTSTAKCLFKATDVFGNTTQSLVKILNQKNCDAAGGKWITENYCEGSVAVTFGRCEYKFNEERNCDKTCFACEYSTGSGFSKGAGITVNSTNADEACRTSLLGFCEFSTDSNAPNGIGYCKSKDVWKLGIAGDCDASCGDCTFKGNPNLNDTTKKPSYYCEKSKANSAGGGCKWIADNSTTIGGYCLEKGALTCLDSCDRCGKQTDCANIGRTAVANKSGSCKWQGAENAGSCVANIAGDVEVCWNGEDDDGDGLVDCADNGCYSDSYCGFVQGDCSIWSTSNITKCETAGCEWVVDKWGSWCGYKGSQCWKFDNNESSCYGAKTMNETINLTSARLPGNEINISNVFVLSKIGGGWVVNSIVIINESGKSLAGNFTIDYSARTINFSNNSFMKTMPGNITIVNYSYTKVRDNLNCEWSNGTGSGWCERDWSIAEVCMGLNRTQCSSGANCVFSNDTWCSSAGNGTDWCKNFGGWCDHVDFASKNCWEKQDNSTCSARTGCTWKTDAWSQQSCWVNWSSGCSNQMSQSSCTGAGCTWKTDSWGSWCTHPLNTCYDQYNKTACDLVSGARCSWRNYTGGGSCEPSCYNASAGTSSSVCSAISGCIWREGGWCEEQQSAGCYNSTNANNQTGCEAAAGCKWNSPGWCSARSGGFSVGTIAGGGGAGGNSGADCYKYNGNQSICTNKNIINISCGWFPEPKPYCNVDWGTECWRYTSVDLGCNATNGCWFKNDSYGSWCMNIMDQCWSNSTLQNNTVACNANPYCNATTYGCEANCFSRTSEGDCNIAGCKWISGWCNPSGTNKIFDSMEAGAPMPLGSDACGTDSVSQLSVDICGFGMKDMGDAFGFGVMVNDFSNASICNKEKISSHVVGFAGGDFGPGGSVGSEKVGAGNDSVSFFVYLDTDGATRGGCALSHNSSAEGYEFRLRYISEWNANKSKAVETFTAYDCENGAWKTTDIKLSTWKKLMCSEIGGAMIAIAKGDLARFPTLYDSSKDMRVYVASAGNTGNVSSPIDSAGPGWTTPGSIDFEIGDVFSYGVDVAKFESILREGFTKGEDCFNSRDDDGDVNVDCSDWDCQFSSACSGSGVNAAGYTDTKSPQVIGVKIEEYPDAALIMYDTNKPTNGTLEFYKNDSRCLSLNASVQDIGITSAKVSDHKLWHTAEIYSDKIGYSLSSSTTYYYKLKVCDYHGKCAVSKCSSFTTSTASQCGFCNFVTRIKTSSDWIVSYDDNQDGTYEHVQGQVCGANAGLKGNYTTGRRMNIKLAKSDNSVYFEFINASVSKTALNDKVRTVSSSGDIIGTSTLVGLTSETRDKIINNLHPEICRIKVPYSGSCNQLYHCDDNGVNCTERTSSATLLDSANCVWEVPNCEFSTYTESTSSGSSSSSSGGGGGGGGGTGGKTYSITGVQVKAGFTAKLSKGDKIKINMSGTEHFVIADNISALILDITVSSTPQKAVLNIGETKNFDVTDDGIYDLAVLLNSIANASVASVSVKEPTKKSAAEDKIQEKVGEESAREQVGTIPETQEKGKSKLWVWILGILAIAVIAGVLIGIRRKKRKFWGYV